MATLVHASLLAPTFSAGFAGGIALTMMLDSHFSTIGIVTVSLICVVDLIWIAVNLRFGGYRHGA